MAVFPDRIVLKNSTDDEATIISEIETGGVSAITQGEVVLGLADGAATLYTKDSVGDIVSISGSGGGGGVTSIIAGSGISVDQATGDVTVTATGGGGGAVDSVNGETGVVSLGIQDMDDFELGQIPPGTPAYTGYWDTKTAGGAGVYPEDQGEWFSLTGTGDAGNGLETLSILMLDDLDKDGNSFATLWAEIDATPADYSLRYTDTNGINGPFQILGLSQQAEGRAAIYWALGDYPGDSPAGEIYVEFIDNTSAVDIPLAEGDILQWNEATQKFNPAQLSGGGGAVDSVNGETGVVTLGIQDMDDYSQPSEAPWPYVYSSDSDAFVSGEVSFLSNVFRINFTDGDGTSHFSELTGTATPFSIWVSANGEFVEATVTSTTTVSNYITLDTGSGWWPHTFPTAGDEVAVSLYDPTTIEPAIADGEALQWNETDQKFKPATLVQWIDGLDDVSNYMSPPFSSTGRWTQEIVTYAPGSIQLPASSGEWSLYETSSETGTFVIHEEDSDGTNHSTLLSLVVASPTSYSMRVKSSVNPLVSTILTFSGATALSGNRYRLTWSIASDPLNPADYNTGGYSQSNEGFSHGPFSNTIEAEIDLASNLASSAPTDGQVLTWIDASNRWQPADAASGSGGGITLLADAGDVYDYYPPFNVVGRWDSEIIAITTGGNLFPTTAGKWASYESNTPDLSYIFVATTDSLSTDHTALLDAVVANPTDYSFRIKVNGGDQSVLVPVASALQQDSGSRYRIDFSTADLDPATYNQDGYSAASPSTSSNGPYSSALELDLRLTSSFPLGVADGQVLAWVDANSQWEPTSLSGAVDSVNGETGAVSLGVDNMDDYQAPPGDPDFSSVALLLYGEGVNGGTVITDSGPNAFTPLVVSDVTTNTAEFKYGSSSLAFNNGYVTYPADTSFDIGSGNFTFEGYFRFRSTTQVAPLFAQYGSLSPVTDFSMQAYWSQTQNVLYLVWTLDGVNRSINGLGSFAPTINTWYHIAYVRSSGQIRVYVDGVQTGSTKNMAGSIYASSSDVQIGGGFGVGFLGDMDDVRFTKGVARYTSNFTPPAAQLTGEFGPPSDGQVLTWDDANNRWEPADTQAPADSISLTTLKAETAASTDFADFQSRIAAL